MGLTLLLIFVHLVYTKLEWLVFSYKGHLRQPKGNLRRVYGANKNCLKYSTDINNIVALV
ncbi:hypothetical protein GCM10027442_03860 [Emticicia fontis]